jgi:hypothetical protein
VPRASPRYVAAGTALGLVRAGGYARAVKVFISWSGEKSKAVAEALHDWLPYVIQEINPFMSESDIAAGARWLNEIDEQLEGTNFAIVCVTRDNQSASWLNFEAGAVAKTIDTSRVVPLAIDLTLSDVKPRLGHFQAKDISPAGIMAVLESLNEHANRPVSNLAAAFEKWWPDLQAKLQQAVKAAEPMGPVRTERELLEEVLASVRSLGERSTVGDELRARLAETEARTAMMAHQAESAAQEAAVAHKIAADAQRELDARRHWDGSIADRVLHEVIAAAPPRSHARVLDDHLMPRLVMMTAAPLTA